MQLSWYEFIIVSIAGRATWEGTKLGAAKLLEYRREQERKKEEAASSRQAVLAKKGDRWKMKTFEDVQPRVREG